MPRNGIFKLITLVFVLLAAAITVKYFIDKSKTKQLVQESESALAIGRAASELLALWRSGDPAMMAPYCRELFDPTIIYSAHYMRCNPDYLKCLLSQRPKFDEVEASWLRVNPAKSGQNWSLSIRLNHKKMSQILNLEDSCSSVELPKRRYAFKTNRGDVLWDNFDRSIFIDRSPVSWREIEEWVNTQNIKLINQLPTISPQMRHQPASGLVQEEMQAFCKYRGKVIASLPVFEAASYHPRDVKNIRPKRVVRSPYPWTIYRKNDFLYRARNKAWRVNREDCRKAYVAECMELGGPEKFSDPVPTWTGVTDTIGGIAEYFVNPFEPNKNFFFSNQKLPAASSWHELGRYGFWNGAGFSSSDFTLDDNINLLEFPIAVGFRCMVEKE